MFMVGKGILNLHLLRIANNFTVCMLHIWWYAKGVLVRKVHLLLKVEDFFSDQPTANEAAMEKAGWRAGHLLGISNKMRETDRERNRVRGRQARWEATEAKVTSAG